MGARFWCCKKPPTGPPDHRRVLTPLIPTLKFVVGLSWIIWILSVAALVVSINDAPKKSLCKATDTGTGDFAMTPRYMITPVDSALAPMCRRWVKDRDIGGTCWGEDVNAECDCWVLYRLGQCIVLLERPASSSVLILIAFIMSTLGVMCIWTTIKTVKGFTTLRNAEHTLLMNQGGHGEEDGRETVAFSVDSDEGEETGEP